MDSFEINADIRVSIEYPYTQEEKNSSNVYLPLAAIILIFKATNLMLHFLTGSRLYY